MEQLSSKGLPTVKRMSDTRWSARADATKALVEPYDNINDALVEIAGNEEEKAETREEARGLAAKMNQLETGILATLWHHILHRFHANTQALQSANQDLNSAVAIYESLIDFIGKQRARFEEFEPEENSSVNVTSMSAKRNECVSEITATMSQDQHRNCRRPLPISSIWIRSLS